MSQKKGAKGPKGRTPPAEREPFFEINSMTRMRSLPERRLPWFEKRGLEWEECH